MARVLIVEDDPPIREMLNDFLGSEGFDTLLAENGRAGVDLARAERPDLILIDIMLPLLDGVTAIKMLRADEETRDLPIVAMTANPTLLRRPDPLPVDVVIGKPFDLDALLDIITVQMQRVGDADRSTTATTFGAGLALAPVSMR